MKRAIAILGATLVLIAALTWWALESGGVAILETRAADGALRSTHVWFAEPNGELWLEAGTPENPWYLDILRDPLVSFSAPGRSGRYVALPAEDSAAHEEIRSNLREKYGLRDRWVALLFDPSRSVAVQLVSQPVLSP